MPRSILNAGLLSALLTVIPTFAQDATIYVEPDAAMEVSEVPPARLAAGVREYPAGVLRCLLQLADQPLVLRQLADNPDLLEHPETINPPVSTESYIAISELSAMPAIVAVAADHPLELKMLRELYTASPGQMEESILQLRADYDHANLGAALNWQQTLENNPAALQEYRKLVTHFCQTQLDVYPDYPCIQVTADEYYYACPPNEAILFHAIDNAESSEVLTLIEQWWSNNSPYELDARILDPDVRPIEFTLTPGVIAALPPEQRGSMWKPLAGKPTDSVNLVPVIMQPPLDLPPEAYYARAVAEHARLWTPEIPPDSPENYTDSQNVDSISSPYSSATNDYIVIDDEPYTTSTQEMAYHNNPWDYTTNWEYYPAAQGSVRYNTYHTYYSPLAVYYRGYPIDWPIFHRCDPDWLIRFRVCATYCHAGSGIAACFNLGRRTGGYYDYSRCYRPLKVVKIGRRHYHRYSRSHTVHAMRHYRTRHSQSIFCRNSGTRPDRLNDRSTRVYHRIYGTQPPGHRTHRATGTSTRPRLLVPRRGSTTGRRPVISQRRPTSEKPRTLRPPQRSGNTRRIPGVSSRPPTSSIPKRNITPRPRTGSTPKRTIAPRRGGNAGGNSKVVPRRSTRPKKTRIAAPLHRTGGSQRKSSVSPRPHASPTPKRNIAPRRGGNSRRSSNIMPRRSTGPKPKRTIAPRHGSSGRGSSMASPPSTSRKSKNIGASRRPAPPQRKSSLSPRPRTSSKSRKATTPQRGHKSSQRTTRVSPGRLKSSRSGNSAPRPRAGRSPQTRDRSSRR